MIPEQIIINDCVTFESAKYDKYAEGKNAPGPVSLMGHLPSWYKHLKANLLDYRKDEFRYNNTVRKCKGMREHLKHSYTIPLYEQFTGDESWYVRKIFQPEMMYGTKFCDKDQQGNYIWDFALFAFPWRAKLPKGHSIMTSPYGLEWIDGLEIFTGIAPTDLPIIEGKNSTTNLWSYNLPIDEAYSYANIEGVIAYKKGILLEKNTVLFSFTVVKT